MLAMYRRHLDTMPASGQTARAYQVRLPNSLRWHLGREACPIQHELWQLDPSDPEKGELEDFGGPVRKRVAEAIDASLTNRQVEPSTTRKYKRIVTLLTEFAAKRSFVSVDQLTLEYLDSYRATR
jgi:hypothetical protein